MIMNPGMIACIKCDPIHRPSAIPKDEMNSKPMDLCILEAARMLEVSSAIPIRGICRIMTLHSTSQIPLSI